MKKLILLFSIFQFLPAFAVSSFNEIKSIIATSEPTLPPKGSAAYEKAVSEALIYKNGQLPNYPINLSTLAKAGKRALENDSKRTIENNSDALLRIEKLIHSSGVCLTGTWQIDQPNPYSGLFSTGSQALLIARISSPSSNTTKGRNRSFGFAGKLFPTLDPNQKVQTANFFAVDSALGTDADHFMKTSMTNQPAPGTLSAKDVLRGVPLVIARVTAAVASADQNFGFRPLYPISRAGLAAEQQEHTPRWIMIRPSPNQTLNDESDFRSELNFKKYYPNGVDFQILVSDTTNSPLKANQWQQIGSIHTEQSFLSYGCDRQIHFQHPKMRPQDKQPPKNR